MEEQTKTQKIQTVVKAFSCFDLDDDNGRQILLEKFLKEPVQKQTCITKKDENGQNGQDGQDGQNGQKDGDEKEREKEKEKEEEKNEKDIKTIIRSDLVYLSQKIEKRISREFMALPEIFEDKYGHWHVLSWIVGRWVGMDFFYGKKPEELETLSLEPKWLCQICLALYNEPPFTQIVPRYVSSVVKQMLTILDS